MLTVIGCGNPARSDDGAGVEVVRRLGTHGDLRANSMRLIDAGTAGMDVMFKVRGAERVVIVDACRSGSDPGAVFRVPGDELKASQHPAFTLHGLRWDHALYAGSRMFGDDFARHTDVFLIEAASLDFGIGLSDAVERGVERVVAEIAALVREHAGAA
jgi:hydrogenase maturation protease